MTAKELRNEAATTAKILVVDDNEQNLELLQAYLEELDCQTVTALDGLQALEVVAKDKPDLVLLDIMSGFEVCKRIKANPSTQDIPIIMVTALNEFGDIERGINSGTDDFVSKPVNRLELLARVKTMLKSTAIMLVASVAVGALLNLAL